MSLSRQVLPPHVGVAEDEGVVEAEVAAVARARDLVAVYDIFDGAVWLVVMGAVGEAGARKQMR
ncbi:MAG: hypothetical protein AAGI71_13965 [Bacteroidota bacterium]